MNLRQKLSLTEDPILLMDGTAFIYRSFYANRHLKRSDGFPTNTITLLARVLLRILKQENPKHFLFVMDGKGRNFRKEIYKEYKANRESMPEDLAMQIEPVKRMVHALGIPCKIAEEGEADDCIASLAARFSASRPVVIVSGDKDLKQCLRPTVYMWDPALKEEKLLTAAEFEKTEGVSPEQWPDVQALTGDSSDNIPGVPGIGPKTARQIFEKCATLEDIRDHLDMLPPKIQARLEPHLEQMFTWRELTTLRRDACPSISLTDLATTPINAEECQELAKEYELASIGREAEKLAERQANADAVLTAESAHAPAARLEWPPAPAIAKITDLPDCFGLPVALVWPNGIKAPCRVAVTDEREWQGSMADLCQWLANAAQVFLPDLKVLLVGSPSWRAFLHGNPSLPILDLALASWLLDPDDGNYTFTRLSLQWKEYGENLPKGPAQLALDIGQSLLGRLRTEGLLQLYNDLEFPLVPVLAQMQLTGFAIDPASFRRFLDDVQKELDVIVADIHAKTGEKINLRSSQQLGGVLFGKMGLPTPKRTAGGQYSTSQAVLEKLATDYPVVENILKFRKLEKMRSTYLDPLPRLMDANDRIHSTFNQEATATGRLSSSDPNLQNIPVRGELGQRMRACFVAASGNLLIAADYSQIELRVLAHLSQDAHLLEAFRNGEDIHRRTAALVFDADQDEISADQRRMAKTINFGLLYGMGSRKLAQELKISSTQAKDFIDRYFARLSGLKTFYDTIIAEAREKGHVRTMGGRMRWLPEINSANGQARAQAERQAVNTVIQGSAADIVKLAMLAAANDTELAEMNAKMTLQVHDELLVEAPEAVAAQAGGRVAFLMRSARPGGQELSVPLLVDWGIGKNWSQAH